MSDDHYVRTYDPVTDTAEWLGPFPMHMAGLVAMGFEGQRQTRVYHRSELPAAAERAGAAPTLDACVPSGCQCSCHKPMPGMTVAHAVPCCGRAGAAK